MQNIEVLLEKKRDKKEFKTMKKILHQIKPYGFIGPLCILLFSFYIIPIFLSMYFSFTDYSILKKPNYVGLLNYRDLFFDKTLKVAIKNTFIFTLGVVPIQTILSLLIAQWLVSRGKSKLTEFAKGAMFVPVISSMVLVSIVWRILLNGENSPLNMMFKILHISQPDWLGNTSIVLFVLMGITVWKNVGYFMILYIAGLMDIPKEYVEAAKVDGAGKISMFYYITLPQLKSTTIMVVFLGVAWSLQTFDLIYTLTGGGPGNSSMTLVLHIYHNAFKSFNAGYAMTVANVLLLISALGAIIQKKFIKKDKSEIY